MKSNTKVWVLQGYGQREAATIRPWRKVAGPKLEGWQVVEFADGHKIIAHEDGLEVRQ